MAKQTKYRPSLTAEQVRYIVSICKTTVPMTELPYSLIQVLDPFLTKIGNKSIIPSHIKENKPKANSMMALVGGDTCTNLQTTDVSRNTDLIQSVSEAILDCNIIDPNSFGSKMEYWEACYKKYQSNPASCNLEEITNSQEHRYLEKLMSPEEVAAFEKQQFQDFNQ